METGVRSQTKAGVVTINCLVRMTGVQPTKEVAGRALRRTPVPSQALRSRTYGHKVATTCTNAARYQTELIPVTTRLPQIHGVSPDPPTRKPVCRQEPATSPVVIKGSSTSTETTQTVASASKMPMTTTTEQETPAVLLVT